MGSNAIGRAIAGTDMCALLCASSSHVEVCDSVGRGRVDTRTTFIF